MEGTAVSVTGVIRSELLAATDKEIDDAVQYSDPLALRGLIYQLTGDESLLHMEVGAQVREMPQGSFVGRGNGLVNDADVELVRQKAAAFLKSYRDRGAGDISIGPVERLRTSLNLAAGEEISADELRASLRKSTIALKVFPVVVGTSFKNKGVQPLLDAVVDYLPSPLDVPETHGTNPDNGEAITRKADDKEPFSALAFKIMADPFVGQLTFIRVYSGQLKTGDSVLNVRTTKTERIGRLLKMHANKREEISEILAGDICAVVGLKNVGTGDTICSEDKPIALESITFAVPVISVAVEPKTKADQEKMGMALGRLAQEDPTFKVHTDPDSGQTIISGMGELHLEIIVDRMMREYKVEANVGKPQVAYRETIRKHSEAEGKYIRQTGGKGQYGHAKIYLDPQPPGTGYEFVNDITGGSVPKEFIKPIDQGIREALEGGILAGYPMVDVKATLYDGSYHDVDSNEMAFKIAGSMAFKEAARKASPVLLEPVMAVEVVTPEDYAGVIMGDLSSRRGRIEGMEHRAGSQVIKAIVPLAEMFGYATHMRSSTQGRAEYSMHFARYEEAPRSVAEEIIAKVQGTTK